MSIDIFANESTIAFSYDYFEAGLGRRPGTWASLSASNAVDFGQSGQRLAPEQPDRGQARLRRALPFADQSSTPSSPIRRTTR